MTATDDDLTYDPFEEFNRAMGADGDASPYPDFIGLRSQGPVLPGFGAYEAPAEGETPMVFTAYTYEAVQTVLQSDAFSSSQYADVMGVVFGHSILEMDEPEHHHYRSLIQQAFTRKAMETWEREVVTSVVNDKIDAFADQGRTEIVRNLMWPFPVDVIAALMDLPRQDLPRFHQLAVEVIGVTIDWDRALRASAELRDYFSVLVDARRGSDAPDLISVLARAEHDGEHLTDEEIFAFLRLLLPAGAETTYRSSSNLLFGLLSDPDQLAALRADRSLMPQAIEEGIRWECPLTIIVRAATTDVDVCGVTVPAGATVVCNLGAANHDPARWDNPERFDIFRERKPHIGFAHGPHMCLGMHLARMETTVALNAILDRLPDLRFDPEAAPHHISGSIFRAPPRLDVVWG